MIDNDIMAKLTENTNILIRHTMSNIKPETLLDTGYVRTVYICFPYKLYVNHDTQIYRYGTTFVILVKLKAFSDIRAFIGLALLLGIKGSSLDKIQRIFSLDEGVPYFSACRSLNRFRFILQHLGFEEEHEKINRTQNWESDRY